MDACCLTCFSHCFSPLPLGKPLIEAPYPVGCSTRMPLYNGYGQHCRTVFTSSKASPKTRQNLWSWWSPEFRTPKVFNLKKKLQKVSFWRLGMLMNIEYLEIRSWKFYIRTYSIHIRTYCIDMYELYTLHCCVYLVIWYVRRSLRIQTERSRRRGLASCRAGPSTPGSKVAATVRCNVPNLLLLTTRRIHGCLQSKHG